MVDQKNRGKKTEIFLEVIRLIPPCSVTQKIQLFYVKDMNKE